MKNLNYKEAATIVSSKSKYLTLANPRRCPCFNSKFDDSLTTKITLFNSEFDYAIRLTLSTHGSLQYAEQRTITAGGCAPMQLNLQSSLKRSSFLLLTGNFMIMLYEIAEQHFLLNFALFSRKFLLKYKQNVRLPGLF